MARGSAAMRSPAKNRRAANRIRTSNFINLSWLLSLIVCRTRLFLSGRNHVDHPADAKSVFKHAKARRPKRLAQRHVDLAAVGQRGESFVRLGLSGHRERQRKA